jgi:hypothetical protein
MIKRRQTTPNAIKKENRKRIKNFIGLNLAKDKAQK